MSEKSRTPIDSFGRWLADTPDAWPKDATHAAVRQYIDIMGVTILGSVNEVHSKSLRQFRHGETAPARLSDKPKPSARRGPLWSMEQPHMRKT
jgi:hypothetical protein